jgi:NAD(P)-dependent dehydrogenase (short-subunit alcohol dehydrogenase family)
MVRMTLETNLYGPLLLSQQLVPLMRRNNYGRLVNVSSGLGQLATMRSGAPSYRLSKAALNALTRILAAELGGPISWSTACVRGTLGPQWEDPVPRDPLRKAPTRLSGWRPFPMTVRPGAFSAIASQYPGRLRSKLGDLEPLIRGAERAGGLFRHPSPRLTGTRQPPVAAGSAAKGVGGRERRQKCFMVVAGEVI